MPNSPRKARMSNFMQKRERYLARPDAIMHIGYGLWANLLKGGDAKPPVYGTARGVEPSFKAPRGVQGPMTAGLPDGATPVARAVCNRLHTIPPRADVHEHAAPCLAEFWRTVGFCIPWGHLTPAGGACHIAFLSAVIYG